MLGYRERAQVFLDQVAQRLEPYRTEADPWLDAFYRRDHKANKVGVHTLRTTHCARAMKHQPHIWVSVNTNDHSRDFDEYVACLGQDVS